MCKLAKYVRTALFSGKIYTSDTNFTRPPVATVATNSKSVNKGYSTSHILVVSSSPLFVPGLWSQINFSPTSEFCQIRFQAALVLKLTISLSGAQKQCLSLFQHLRLLCKYLQVHRQQHVGWWAVNWTKLPLK